MSEFILASGSSRRHSLIEKFNLEYRVCVPNIDESAMIGEMPEDYVCRMAREKAMAVIQSNNSDNTPSNNKASTLHQAVLAADTIVVFAGEILGKPINNQDARRILQTLSAQEHEVLTALFIKYEDQVYQVLARTKVKFKLLTDMEIEAYCLSEEPYDKAGAYAIQGTAASFIEYISGSYTNVMGLPLLAMCKLLAQTNLYTSDNLIKNLDQKRYNV